MKNEILVLEIAHSFSKLLFHTFYHMNKSVLTLTSIDYLVSQYNGVISS